jgi:hypothetical protein
MPGLTRRAFLGRSALAATVPWWLPGGLLGSVGMAKCISMGSINHGGDPQDLRAIGNLARVLETGAPAVRLWIRWDKAQPIPPAALPLDRLDTAANDVPGCGSGCGFRYIRAIDAQVALARRAGLRVVLATWHFPRWANGTEGRPADWAREDRGVPGAPPEQLKSFELRFPVGQLGPDGAYGRWLGWLMDRYRAHGSEVVLEVMNEPNHQLWPQSGMPERVAEMMVTAATVAARREAPIGLAGPALSDRLGDDTRLMTGFESATEGILAALAARGFGDHPAFVWTHHNYSDVERDLDHTRAARLRALLDGRWTGRGGRSDPRIWLTEGGARLGSHAATGLPEQAALLSRNWERMRATPGVELYTNYLLYANPTTDSGLRAADGAPRPVWNAFRALPAYG